MTAHPSPEKPVPAQSETDSNDQPGFGWTQYAEKINGRFAMVGFIALLVTELVAKQNFFTWIGLR